MLFAFAVSCAALGAGGTVHAQMYCTEPVTPLCAQDPQNVQSPAQESLCLESLERFSEDLEEFQNCLRENVRQVEAQRERTEAFRACLDEEGFGDCESLDR
jgi:hypothetical protein